MNCLIELLGLEPQADTAKAVAVVDHAQQSDPILARKIEKEFIPKAYHKALQITKPLNTKGVISQNEGSADSIELRDK